MIPGEFKYQQDFQKTLFSVPICNLWTVIDAVPEFELFVYLSLVAIDLLQISQRSLWE